SYRSTRGGGGARRSTATHSTSAVWGMRSQGGMRGGRRARSGKGGRARARGARGDGAGAAGHEGGAGREPVAVEKRPLDLARRAPEELGAPPVVAAHGDSAQRGNLLRPAFR